MARARRSGAAARAAPPEPANAPTLKLVAMREHSLLSLFELSHELTVVLDASGIAELALFNLMGHLGTRLAALFLERDSSPGTLEALRFYGLRPEIAEALAVALEPSLTGGAQRFSSPIRIEEAARVIEPAAVDLAERSGVTLFAPLIARQAAIGFVAVGRRGSNADFSDLDLDVLNASLGMVAVAFENRRLYGRLERQNRGLASANQKLRELDQLKSEFLQNVNHELRTPLAVILGSMDCLMQEPDTDARRTQFLVAVQEQASKLRDMVQTLLDFASTLDGSLELVEEELDLAAELSGYHSSRRARIEATHAPFTLRIASSPAPAIGDRARVIQVLDFLLDNAIKFCPPGTPIEIGVGKHVAGGRAWTRVWVSDRGPGIDPEQLPHLFRPFRQVDGSPTRRHGGLGMGLATASRLAERMNGSLTAESELGRGSTLALLLPTSGQV